MMLEVTEGERDVLLGILHERLGELRQEERHSRVPSFTEELKSHEKCVRELIEKLETETS